MSQAGGSDARIEDAEPIIIMSGADAERFFPLSSSRQLHNMIDGLVYAAPPPSDEHEEVVYAIESALKAFQREHGGRVIRSRYDCCLSDTTVVQPDTGYVVPERTHLIGTYLRGAPDLAIEVVSRGTRAFDTEAKFEAYGKGGVREAWFVDLEAKQVTVVIGDGEAWNSERAVAFGEVIPSEIVSARDANLTSE